MRNFGQKHVCCVELALEEGVKGIILWYNFFNFRERWKYEIKTRILWLVCFSWNVVFKIFYPIFVIFN